MFRQPVGGSATTSNSHGVLALLRSGSLALVPESTQPGDLIAGLLLPSFTHATNSFLVLGDRAPKEHDLEASLTEIFGQRIRPVLHCSMVGHYWMRSMTTLLTFDYSEDSTPEYKSEVIEGRASFYDIPWKRIMAGSALLKSLGQFNDQFLNLDSKPTPSIFDSGSFLDKPLDKALGEYLDEPLGEPLEEPLNGSLNLCADKSSDKSLGELLDGSDGLFRIRPITWKTFAIH